MVAKTSRLKLICADIVSCRPCSPNQQAVKGNSRNIHDSFNMELKTSKSEYGWLNACYTGIVKSPDSMTSLGAQLNKVGISKCDPTASLSVDPPVSFVAESKQSGRNTKSPAMAFARESNQHRIYPRGVDTAAGINEGFQNPSVSERVSDTVRTSRDTAHKVGGGDATGCRHSRGRDVGMTTWACIQSPKVNQNNEEPTGPPGPQTAMRGSQVTGNCLKPTKTRKSEFTQSGAFKKKKQTRKRLVEDILQLRVSRRVPNGLRR
ncbi:hypothetical protein Ancab_034745 [Ancistrocladus abbreviatus]